MLILESLELFNFGPYVHEYIRLLELHLAAVIGTNGSGKSTIFEGISFILYGRGYKGGVGERQNFIRRRQPDPAKGVLIVHGDAGRFRITRSIDQRGGSHLFFESEKEDGEWENARTGKRDTQKCIEDLIGMDYDTFTASCMMTQDNINDLANGMKDADRIKVFQQVFGLTHWKDQQRRAGEEIRRLNEEISILSRRIDDVSKELAIYDEIAAEKVQVDKAMNQLQTDIRARNEEISKIDVALAEFVQVEKDLTQACTQLTSARVIESELKEKMNSLQKKKDTLNNDRKARAALITQKESIEQAQREVSEIELQIAGNREKFELYTQVNMRLTELTTNQTIALNERHTEILKYENERKAIEETGKSNRNEINSMRDEMTKQNETLTAVAALISQSNEIEEAAKRNAQLQQQIDDSIVRQQQHLALRDQLAGAERNFAKETAIRETECRVLQSQLDMAKKQAALLREVPCGGQGEHSTCSLLQQAVAANATCAQLERKIDEIKSNPYQHEEQVQNVKTSITGLNFQQGELERLQDEQRATRSLANRLSDLRMASVQKSQAEDRIRSLQNQIDEKTNTNHMLRGRFEALAVEIENLRTLPKPFCGEIEITQSELTAILYDPAADERLNRLLSGKKEIAKQITACLVAIEQIRLIDHQLKEVVIEEDAIAAEQVSQNKLVEQLDGSIESLKKALLPLTQLRANRENIENRKIELQNQVMTTAVKLGGLQEKLAKLDASKVLLDEFKLEKEQLLEEKMVHNYIQEVCEEVPIFVIENNIPEIERFANLLLQRLTGGKYTVRIDTQGENKDGSLRDGVLQINVQDNLDVAPFKTFSGEERFVISYALRGALSWVASSRRSSGSINLFIVDEGISKADEVNRRLILDTMFDLSKVFRQMIFATHIDEIKELAPQRIEVLTTDAGSKVKVIA